MTKLLKKLYEILISLGSLFKWALIRVCKLNIYRCKIGEPKTTIMRILGNGPSLLNFVKNFQDRGEYDFCCVNDSLLSESYFHIKPKYHLFIDQAYFCEGYLDNIGLTKKIMSIDWDIYMIVPFGKLKLMRQLYSQNKHVHYIGYPGGLSLEMKLYCLRFYLFKKGLASPPAQNVIIAAIYHMIMEGYKVIELYGVEHSWLRQIVVNDKNELCQVDCHFYDKDKPKLNVWKSVPGGVPFKVHEILGFLKKTFEAYHDLNRFAKYMGAEIYNCTPGSYIDAFVRKYDTMDSI